MLVVLRMQGEGHRSGIGVDDSFAQVLTIRDNKVARMNRYGDRAEALESVGLSK